MNTKSLFRNQREDRDRKSPNRQAVWGRALQGFSLLALVAGLCGTTSVAQGQGWSLRNLNPLAEKSSKKSPKKPATKFSLPSMPKLPKWGTWPKPPNLLAPVSKLGKSTKKFFVKTAGYLSPSHLMPSKEVRRTSHSSSRKWPRTSEKKKSSLIPSLFRRPSPPPPPQTVQDFLRLKRIKP